MTINGFRPKERKPLQKTPKAGQLPLNGKTGQQALPIGVATKKSSALTLSEQSNLRAVDQ